MTNVEQPQNKRQKAEAEKGAKGTANAVILSEAKNLSLA
jgi:hypothetical protein